MIRVIAGKFKHRVLKQPSMSITRSTKDVCKEGLFSSLGDISELSFLDLFSGSGAIGIEAFSRGAFPVYLNDVSKEAISIIKENLRNLKIENEIKVFNLDYLKALKRFNELNISFDIIFLDPPYKMIIDFEFISNLLKFNVLKENGIIVAETDYPLDQKLIDLYHIKQLKYGRSSMYIIRGF